MSAIEQVEVVDGEPVQEYAVVPYTGEMLALRDMTNEQLADVLQGARDWERSKLAAFKRDVQDEVLARMDARAASGEPGAWTIHEGTFTLTGDGPDRTEYDVDEVRKALLALVDDGVITEEALDTVIVPERYKVAKKGLAQLLKVPGVKAVIEPLERPVTRPRNVTVKTAGR